MEEKFLLVTQEAPQGWLVSVQPGQQQGLTRPAWDSGRPWTSGSPWLHLRPSLCKMGITSKPTLGLWEVWRP